MTDTFTLLFLPLITHEDERLCTQPGGNFFSSSSSLECSFKSSAKFSIGLISIIISVFKVNVLHFVSKYDV